MTSTSPTPEPDRTTLPWVDDQDERPRRSRTWTLVGVATIPWVVVALVLLRPAPQAAPAAPAPPAPSPAGSTSSTPAAGTPLASPVPGEPEPTATGGVASDPAVVQLRSGARHAPATGDAVAVAVLVARGWLGTATPSFAGPFPARPAADRYVEHVTVEAVDHPAPGDVAVTLVATVLDLAGQTPEVAVLRLAVPVRLDAAGARPAGKPWLLPPPDLSPDPPSTSAVDDPDLLLAAAEALTAAGYDVREVTGLERTDGWPWLVTADVVEPGGRERAGARLWLRRHLGAFVVAGWLPAGQVGS